LFIMDHIEAQVVGDFLGHCFHVWERQGPLSPELAGLKALYAQYY
jgi:hypothetical protein